MDSFNSKKRTTQEDFFDCPSKKKIKPQDSSEEGDEQSEGEEQKGEGTFANEVIFIRFVTNPSDMLDSNRLSFNPEFTNQIFGEKELIKGYEDLKITINFTTCQFYANIDISYTQKAENADDLQELFGKWFHGGYLQDKNEFEKLLSKEKLFKPLGKNIKNFKIEDQEYEMYFCDFSVEGFSDYNTRLQILFIFFIDGASFIEEDHNWRVYLLYKKEDGLHKLIGLTTVYTFFQEIKTCRFRISQFLILPPYQRKGFGMHLISKVYEDALNDSSCYEITVEDAAIGFQYLRDCKDFELVMDEKCFDWARGVKGKFSEKIYFESKKILTRETIKYLRKKYKLTKNQIKRVIEIMKYINLNENDVAFGLFKEDVKARLKEANKAEFYPFLKKKIPYVVFEGIPAIINPAIYKNSNEIEVNSKLEEYVEEILSQYEEIKSKILKIWSSRKNL